MTTRRASPFEPQRAALVGVNATSAARARAAGLRLPLSLTRRQRMFLAARAAPGRDIVGALVTVLEDLAAHRRVVRAHRRTCRARTDATGRRGAARPESLPLGNASRIGNGRAWRGVGQAAVLGPLLDAAMVLAELRACLDTPVTLAREERRLRRVGYTRAEVERLMAHRWVRCAGVVCVRPSARASRPAARRRALAHEHP